MSDAVSVEVCSQVCERGPESVGVSDLPNNYIYGEHYSDIICKDGRSKINRIMLNGRFVITWHTSTTE